MAVRPADRLPAAPDCIAIILNKPFDKCKSPAGTAHYGCGSGRQELETDRRAYLQGAIKPNTGS